MRGVAGGVLVASGGVSCDMFVIVSTLVGEAVFVGVVRRGEKSLSVRCSGRDG